jgi:hypothetical protein
MTFGPGQYPMLAGALLEWKGSLASTLSVWQLIGNALLNFCQRLIVPRYCIEALSDVGARRRARQL